MEQKNINESIILEYLKKQDKIDLNQFSNLCKRCNEVSIDGFFKMLDSVDDPKKVVVIEHIVSKIKDLTQKQYYDIFLSFRNNDQRINAFNIIAKYFDTTLSDFTKLVNFLLELKDTPLINLHDTSRISMLTLFIKHEYIKFNISEKDVQYLTKFSPLTILKFVIC